MKKGNGSSSKDVDLASMTTGPEQTTQPLPIFIDMEMRAY